MTKRLSILITIFLTGATGLVYEVTWHRYLANIVGSEARATAIILAVFLGGLCLGYYIFGKVTERFAKKIGGAFLVKICGLAEISIGLWALLFPTFYKALWNWGGIYNSGALWLDVLVSILLMGFPTILMGGTLPLLTQGLSRDLSDSATFHAKIYAANTGGACIGALAAGFILLPILGLPLTMLSTAFVNIACGLFLYLVGPKIAIAQNALSNKQVTKKEKSEIDATLTHRKILFVSFLAGLYSISIQTILVRLVGISVGSSEYAFSMVVASFVLMLALGAYSVSKYEVSKRSLFINQVLVLGSLAILYLTVPYWPYAVHVVRSLFTSVTPNFYIYFTVIFCLLSLLTLLPIGAMGRTLPLLFGSARAKPDRLGAIVGQIYGLNTIGCVLGAIFGGYLSLYLLDLDDLFRICNVLVYITVLIALPFGHFKLNRSINSLAILATLLFMITTVTSWDKRYFALSTARMRTAVEDTFNGATAFYNGKLQNNKLVDYKDDPNTSVSIVENALPTPGIFGANFSRSIFVNGKSDGATHGSDVVTTRLLGHLPALFRTSVSGDAAVIGFGTGITLGSLSLYDDIKRIDCIEISPFVRKFAPYFDFANHSISKSPKLNWILGDAYRVFGKNETQYDLIVSEPSNPWVSGVERLYAEEFYALAKTRLHPGGIYAQWFHSYDMNIETIGIVVNNFSKAFPFARLFVLGVDMILLGSDFEITESSLSLMKSRLEAKSIKDELSEIKVLSPEHLLSFESPLLRDYFSGFGRHSLEFPTLSYRAGKDFFMGIATNILSILYRDENRKSNLKSESNLLINRYLTQNEEKYSFLNLGNALCKVNLSVPWDSWRRGSLPCLRVVMKLASSGRLDSWGKLLSREKTAMRTLLSSTVVKDSEAKTIQEAKERIRFYFEMKNLFLPFKAERLLESVAPCQTNTSEAVECRIKLVEALANTNDVLLARKEFDKLVNENLLSVAQLSQLDRALLGS